MINKKSRAALGVILAAIVTVLLVSRPWSTSSKSASSTEVARGAPVTVPTLNDQEPRVKSAEVVPATVAPSVSASSSALVAGEFRSLMRHHKNLVLSEEETAKMFQAYARIQARRTAYEASIATKTEISKTENFIEISAYPQEGAKLQEELYSAFAQVVGNDRIEPIKQAIAGDIYCRGFGWGESPQEISIRQSESDPNLYSFTQRVGTIHPIINNTRTSGTYNGALNQFFKSDLGHYTPFSKFLPNI